MSTNSECDFIQVTPTEWFYVLEDSHAPQNTWDWREYATAYGPFRTFAVAHDHLERNHANPGGYSVVRHKDDQCSHVKVERNRWHWFKPTDPDEVTCLSCSAYANPDGTWPGGGFDGTLDEVLTRLIAEARKESARPRSSRYW